MIRFTTLCWVLVSLIGCTQEVGLVPDREYFGTPAPTVIDNELITDTVIIANKPAADILWVIDNSCSMADKQIEIALRSQTIINSLQDLDLDYRVGITTTSPTDERGRLLATPELWLDPNSTDQSTKFETTVQAGRSGSGIESGFDAVYYGVTEHGDPYTYPSSTSDNCNDLDCFMRDYATFHVIVVSDENDQSRGIYEVGGGNGNTFQFINWMCRLKNAGTPIIDMNSTETCNGGVGFNIIGYGDVSKYEQAADKLNGMKMRIYGADWDTILVSMADQFAIARTVYPLTRVPAEDSLTVDILRETTAINIPEGECDMCYTYTRSTNSIKLHGYQPAIGDEVQMTYYDQASSYGN